MRYVADVACWKIFEAQFVSQQVPHFDRKCTHTVPDTTGKVCSMPIGTHRRFDTEDYVATIHR